MMQTSLLYEHTSITMKQTSAIQRNKPFCVKESVDETNIWL